MGRPTNQDVLRKVIRTATQLVATNGYEQTTIAHIGEAAGVSSGYIYRHYSGKEALFRSIYESRLHNYQLIYTGIIEKAPSASGAVRRLLDEWFDHVNSGNTVYNFMREIMRIVDNQVDSEIRACHLKMCMKLRERGLAEQSLKPGWDEWRIYYLLFSVPNKMIEDKCREGLPISSAERELVQWVCGQMFV